MINTKQENVTKEVLAKKIAGEIVLSPDAGKTIQKWRNIFKIPQRKLADEMRVMPSVVSDYESGRRKSPGIKVVKRTVNALLNIDERAGGKITREFSVSPSETIASDAILDMKESSVPVKIKEFCKAIDASILAKEDLGENNIYGYTVIDSLKAIVEMPPTELIKLYGLTSERALIFTDIHRGRSPMVAIKVTNLRPGLIVFHGSQTIDDLAKRIAEVEGIPLALTKISSKEELIKELKKIYK